MHNKKHKVPQFWMEPYIPEPKSLKRGGQLPKYKFGDWLNKNVDVGINFKNPDIVRGAADLAIGWADMGLGNMGMTNVITDKAYNTQKGKDFANSEFLSKYNQTMGTVGQIGLDVAGQAGYGVPGQGTALYSATRGLNPQEKNQSTQMNYLQPTHGMNYNSVPQTNTSPTQDTNLLNNETYYNYGGVLEYKGPSHANGGIPINSNGIPVPRNQASAEVEGNETRYQPTSQEQPYIFSDSIKISVDKNIIAEAKAVGISISKDDTYASLSKKINNKLNEYA